MCIFFSSGKKALEPYNIQYWFKNARAALKRKKRRFAQPDLSNGQLPQGLNSLSSSNINTDDDQHQSSMKCELDSSDEIEADDDDDLDIDDKQKQQQQQQQQQQPQPSNNYYFSCLKAFDISLSDQQRGKMAPSDESNDDDNISSISEQSPPTQISFNHSSSNRHFHTTTAAATTGPSSIDYNRSRRNRIFIDPTSEVPKLEQWFAIETHPDHVLIERICSELNEGEYRTKFPKLESKHIRLWFKNHRAKVKRICRIQTPMTNNETTVEMNEKNMHNVQ